MRVLTSRQRYQDPRAFLPVRGVEGGVRVHRLRATAFGRSGLAGRLLDYLTFYVSVFFAVLWYAHRGETVVTATDPPLLGLVVSPALRLRGARQVNWLHDVFPEIAAELGVRGLSGKAGALLRAMRDRNCRRADANVVLGERMRGYLHERRVPARRLEVIPNWGPEGLRPREHADNPLRAEWGLAGRFVIGYAGNLGRVHEFGTLLEAADRLRGDDRFVFLVTGGGARLDEIRAQARDAGLGNMIFKPYLPRERLSEGLSAVDLHVVSLRPECEAYVVPSKIYGIAAVGRPALFIGDPDGEVARILAQQRFGYSVPPGDAGGFVEAATALAGNPGRYEALCVNAREAHRRHFAPPFALTRWERLLDRLQG